MSDILKQKYSYGDTEFAFQKSFYSGIDIRIKNYFQEQTPGFLETDLKSDDVRFYVRALMDPIADLLKNKFAYDIETLDGLYHETCNGLLNLAKTCKSKKLHALACKHIVNEIPLDFLCSKYNLKNATQIIDTGIRADGDILNALKRMNTHIRYTNILENNVQDALFKLLYLITTDKNLVEELLNNKNAYNNISLFSAFDSIIKELKKPKSTLSLNQNLANMLMSFVPKDIEKISSYIETVQKIMRKNPEYKVKLELLETFLSEASTQERFLHLAHADNPEFKKDSNIELPEFEIVM